MNVNVEFHRIMTEEGSTDVNVELAENERIKVIDARMIGQAIQFDVVILGGEWHRA